MYRKQREIHSDRFACCVTQIAERNQRSLKAHLRAGFVVVHRHRDRVTAEDWIVVAWDWSEPQRSTVSA
jgi:RimJ/RimL family protein N-acetyltransferase